MPIATKSSKIDITKESITAKLANRFAKIFKKGDIIFLHGEIGVGKTTFVKYLISFFQKKRGLQVEVTSPTFNILNEYETKSFIIHHYDLFRIKESKETSEIGLFEDSKKILTIVEWPDKIVIKPKKKYDFYFKYDDKRGKRFLEIFRNDLKYQIDD